ncbi:MAG: RtcB family protein [Saprospiraceae bacterium]|nr:RtcB family protein [Saprospiraceae bacterium]
MSGQTEDITIFGADLIDQQSIDQLRRAMTEDSIGVLNADAHYGYGHPIGGAIAYRDKISLSGVGFDIACGNKAVRTNIQARDADLARVMDEVTRQIGFGLGRPNPTPIDHPVFDQINNLDLQIPSARKHELMEKARVQLGTVGSGNHFVDLFEDEDGWLWIGVHFGSRGFGHTITMGFIAIAHGKSFGERVHEGGMDSPPILFDADSETGQDYLEAIRVAGEYAYAGRNYVVDKILEILGAQHDFEVHNHHNFCWEEEHFGEKFFVVRKGCTPAFPGQKGFVGATMFDTSVILKGIDSEKSRRALYSTVHGAGRVMSRRKARGKVKWQRGRDGSRHLVTVKPGAVDFNNTRRRAHDLGIELRGADADESPECYKDLDEVLARQGETIRVLHRLKPVGVAMAGPDIYDPYKD